MAEAVRSCGNRLLNNSINGLFVRIRTEFGSPVDKLDVSARFKSTDIVYVLQENLFINGGVGGYERKVDPADGLLKYFARKSGRLTVDPGVVVKLQGSRIELERGTSQLIAEGTADRPVIFTSLGDNRFGGGGTFDTNAPYRMCPLLVTGAASFSTLDLPQASIAPPSHTVVGRRPLRARSTVSM